MNITWTAVLIMIVSYFLGNISPSILIGKSMGINIKKAGSGNAGTTNALRVLGKKAAIATFLIDVGKGTAAVLIAMHFLPEEIAVYSAVAVFFGHIWPAVYKFKGGKGVATAFGAILAINWKLGLLTFAVFLVVTAISRLVSLGSILAAVGFIILAWLLQPDFLIPAVIMSATVLIKHRSNMVRLFRGEESKLSFKKAGKTKNMD